MMLLVNFFFNSNLFDEHLSAYPLQNHYLYLLLLSRFNFTRLTIPYKRQLKNSSACALVKFRARQ